MILSNSNLLHNHPGSASDSGHSQAARSPTLSALPPSFPAAHTGPLSSSDFCTGFTLTLLCLHHPHSWCRVHLLHERSKCLTPVYWSLLESDTGRDPLRPCCYWTPLKQPEPQEGPRVQHFPNSELQPHPRGTAQTGSLCTLQLPSPWRSSTSPRCGQCSSLSAPGHSTLLSSAAPPGSSGTPSSPGHRAARRPGGTGAGSEEGARRSPSRSHPESAKPQGRERGIITRAVAQLQEEGLSVPKRTQWLTLPMIRRASAGVWSQQCTQKLIKDACKASCQHVL